MLSENEESRELRTDSLLLERCLRAWNTSRAAARARRQSIQQALAAVPDVEPPALPVNAPTLTLVKSPASVQQDAEPDPAELPALELLRSVSQEVAESTQPELEAAVEQSTVVSRKLVDRVRAYEVSSSLARDFRRARRR